MTSSNQPKSDLKLKDILRYLQDGLRQEDNPRTEDSQIEELFSKLKKITHDKFAQLELPPEVAWLEKLLPAVIQMSIFGGSITFSIIPSIPANAPKGPEVIENLSAAFLIFALALFISSAAELVIFFQRDNIIEIMPTTTPEVETPPPEVKWWIFVFGHLPVWGFIRFGFLSLLLQILPLLAFMYLATVVETFSPGIGLMTKWFMRAFILLAGFIWLIQAIVGTSEEITKCKKRRCKKTRSSRNVI